MPVRFLSIIFLRIMSQIMEAPQQTISSVNGTALPFNLTEVDIATLAQTDEEFIPHSWEELKKIVGGRCLDPTNRVVSKGDTSVRHCIAR